MLRPPSLWGAVSWELLFPHLCSLFTATSLPRLHKAEESVASANAAQIIRISPRDAQS